MQIPKLPILALMLLALGACSSPTKQQTSSAATQGDGKAIVGSRTSPSEHTNSEFDDLDEYAVPSIADPLEPLNRATFWLNHGIYMAIARPISKGYEFLVPKPLRRGLTNVFENIRFPVRAVNQTLQGHIDQSGLETGKFLVNSTAGVGGLIKVSDKIPALASVPNADTGQTLAKWGVGHGIYLVLPIFGPNSTRDTVGLAGDLALNPITWIGFIFGGGFFWEGSAWTTAISGTNTMSLLPERVDAYEAATGQSMDKYLAAKTSWIQYREAIVNE